MQAHATRNAGKGLPVPFVHVAQLWKASVRLPDSIDVVLLNISLRLQQYSHRSATRYNSVSKIYGGNSYFTASPAL